MQAAALNSQSVITSCRRVLASRSWSSGPETSSVLYPIKSISSAHRRATSSAGSVRHVGTFSSDRSSFLQGVKFAPIHSAAPGSGQRGQATRAMAASADLEVFGKAVPFTGQPSARRGDCKSLREPVFLGSIRPVVCILEDSLWFIIAPKLLCRRFVMWAVGLGYYRSD